MFIQYAKGVMVQGSTGQEIQPAARKPFNPTAADVADLNPLFPSEPIVPIVPQEPQAPGTGGDSTLPPAGSTDDGSNATVTNVDGPVDVATDAPVADAPATDAPADAPVEPVVETAPVAATTATRTKRTS